MAEKIKQSAERRVKESSVPGSGVNVDYAEAIREIVAITLRGSDSEFQKRRGELGMEIEDADGTTFYRATFGEELREDLARAERRVETETFKKHGVYEKMPLRERREKDRRRTARVLEPS
jgi:hypothetical protein